MTTRTPNQHAAPAPNHHAHFPAFAGPAGLFMALFFTVGRNGDADLAIDLTGVGPDDVVVDVGCGPGVAARRAARTAGSVIGVDPAAVMLRVGRLLTHRSSARFVEGAAEALPLPDDSATVVWSLATVHHWDDLDAGLAEARRVLRPGGRFLVVERHVQPGATGHASHGWTDDQAASFADLLRTNGFTGVEIGHRRTGRRRRVISVLSRAEG